MQKALNEMNLHLHHVLSDISGRSGLAILDAILAGERDPKKLASLADRRVEKSQAQIEAALTGDYRPELLFVLSQSLDNYRQMQQLIAQYDLGIEKQLAKIADHPEDLTMILECLREGYMSVMFDGGHLATDQNVRETARVAGIAHAHGAIVERRARSVWGRTSRDEGCGGPIVRRKGMFEGGHVDMLAVS
jgi:fructose/tagatose bisphosphate aldolase